MKKREKEKLLDCLYYPRKSEIIQFLLRIDRNIAKKVVFRSNPIDFIGRCLIAILPTKRRRHKTCRLINAQYPSGLGMIPLHPKQKRMPPRN